MRRTKKKLKLTGRSVSGFNHRLRQITQNSGQRFSPRFFTTHNLLIKNETKKSQPSGLGEKDKSNFIFVWEGNASHNYRRTSSKGTESENHCPTKNLLEVRQVWGKFRSEVEGCWREGGEIGNESLQGLSRFTPVRKCQWQIIAKSSPDLLQVFSKINCIKKSASPAGVPRGCDWKKNSGDKMLNTPLESPKLSEVIFRLGQTKRIHP